MKTSKQGIDLIKRFEGLMLMAYPDPGPTGLPITIGYGTTKINGNKVTANMTITKEQAEQYLIADLNSFENCVNSFKLNINQNQFDALVSFCYNLGCGALSMSTLLKLIKNNPLDPKIKLEFEKWCMAGGKRLEGLLLRRRIEWSLFSMECK